MFTSGLLALRSIKTKLNIWQYVPNSSLRYIYFIFYQQCWLSGDHTRCHETPFCSSCLAHMTWVVLGAGSYLPSATMYAGLLSVDFVGFSSVIFLSCACSLFYHIRQRFQLYILYMALVLTFIIRLLFHVMVLFSLCSEQWHQCAE